MAELSGMALEAFFWYGCAAAVTARVGPSCLGEGLIVLGSDGLWDFLTVQDCSSVGNRDCSSLRRWLGSY